MYWNDDAELLAAFGELSCDAEMCNLIERAVANVDEQFIDWNIAERRKDQQRNYTALSSKTLKLVANNNAHAATLAMRVYLDTEDLIAKLSAAVFIEAFTRRFDLAKRALIKRGSKAVPKWGDHDFGIEISKWLFEIEKAGQEERIRRDNDFLKEMNILW